LIDYPVGGNKAYYSATNPKKKAYRIADKTIVVIDQSLVMHFSIDDETWFEQETTEVGILLRISRKSKGTDIN
jgi:hypothetical protein